mmetsp:Transcript_96056/g.310160  ORF Transcript_96056/g.310160 Transcript_96056/m.310160 type:complete len:115 (-) Transcript_96056:1041-1385(-)
MRPAQVQLAGLLPRLPWHLAQRRASGASAVGEPRARRQQADHGLAPHARGLPAQEPAALPLALGLGSRAADLQPLPLLASAAVSRLTMNSIVSRGELPMVGRGEEDLRALLLTT